mgnify:CR=1 FL=1
MKVQEVCEEIGCSKGQLYYAFSSGDGDVVEVEGETVKRTEIKEENKEHHSQKYTYDIVRESSLDEIWAQSKTKFEKAYDLIEELRSLILEDEYALIEMREMIDEEQDRAVELFKQGRQEAMEVLFKDPTSIYRLNEEEQNLIEQYRSGEIEEKEDPSWLVDIDEIREEQEKSEGGSSAVMYGGQPRPKRAKEVEKSLDFDNVDWVPGDGHKRVEAAAQRVENGTYDAVFVLADLAGHNGQSMLKSAAKKSNTDYIRVEHGQSVSRISQAYEQITA